MMMRKCEWTSATEHRNYIYKMAPEFVGVCHASGGREKSLLSRDVMRVMQCHALRDTARRQKREYQTGVKPHLGVLQGAETEPEVAAGLE